jgi:hypothetical protein
VRSGGAFRRERAGIGATAASPYGERTTSFDARTATTFAEEHLVNNACP